MTAAEDQPQQGRRRASMLARMPHQQPAAAAGEDEITDLGEDHGIGQFGSSPFILTPRPRAARFI